MRSNNNDENESDRSLPFEHDKQLFGAMDLGLLRNSNSSSYYSTGSNKTASNDDFWQIDQASDSFYAQPQTPTANEISLLRTQNQKLQLALEKRKKLDREIEMLSAPSPPMTTRSIAEVSPSIMSFNEMHGGDSRVVAGERSPVSPYRGSPYNPQQQFGRIKSSKNVLQSYATASQMSHQGFPSQQQAQSPGRGGGVAQSESQGNFSQQQPKFMPPQNGPITSYQNPHPIPYSQQRPPSPPVSRYQQLQQQQQEQQMGFGGQPRQQQHHFQDHQEFHQHLQQQQQYQDNASPYQHPRHPHQQMQQRDYREHQSPHQQEQYGGQMMYHNQHLQHQQMQTQYQQPDRFEQQRFSQQAQLYHVPQETPLQHPHMRQMTQQVQQQMMMNQQRTSRNPSPGMTLPPKPTSYDYYRVSPPTGHSSSLQLQLVAPQPPPYGVISRASPPVGQHSPLRLQHPPQQQQKGAASPSMTYKSASPSVTSISAGSPVISSSSTLSQQQPPQPQTQTSQVIYTVQFKHSTRDFTPGPLAPATLQKGDFVIVQCQRGEDLGVVVDIIPLQLFVERRYLAQLTAETNNTEECTNVAQIIRIATSFDLLQLPEKARDEAMATEAANLLAQNTFSLPMTIVDASYQFDRQKLTFYYTSEARIDFRELVKELFVVFKTRVWMKKLGGVSTSALPQVQQGGAENKTAVTVSSTQQSGGAEWCDSIATITTSTNSSVNNSPQQQFL